MRILSVDTSSERGSMCIVSDGVILGEIRLASSGQQAEQLFRSVEFLLKSIPLTLADINLFVAGRGPGSFTGLRVGLAAMEGFAAAHGQRGVGISTLEALAWKTGIENELIAPLVDARRGEVYGGLYRRAGNELVEERPPSVLKPEQWLATLPDGRIHLCGDGAVRYRTFVNRPNWLFYDMDLYLAATMAHLAATKQRGPLEPLYIRKTDAETALEARNDGVAGPGPKSQEVRH
jgi:tRNA threonylcarbamoyladenosine biosynthesis protein TsaB